MHQSKISRAGLQSSSYQCFVFQVHWMHNSLCDYYAVQMLQSRYCFQSMHTQRYQCECRFEASEALITKSIVTNLSINHFIYKANACEPEEPWCPGLHRIERDQNDLHKKCHFIKLTHPHTQDSLTSAFPTPC